MENKLFRLLPSVDEVLDKMELEKNNFPRKITVEIIRLALDELRLKIKKGEVDFSFIENEKEIRKGYLLFLKSNVLERLNEKMAFNLDKVINATGVVLHTNLGRALLCPAAIEAVERISQGYCNLEFNLKTGKRGSRYSAVEGILSELTGAEASLVVNNNAAAVLLALNTLAKDKEVIVSRGQLVEIGGSFRIPEIMTQSGSTLVEVGTTNKTYPLDYQKAISENTALLLHVHMSNYRIVGFSRDIDIGEMVEVARKNNLPIMSDLGSGFLVDLEPFGLPKEPTVQEVVERGADVVTFSGDKLLGGPQAGIIVGKSKYIKAMQENPLTRAFRVDKMNMVALEATLREYLYPEKVLKNIPTLKMLSMDLSEIKLRAENLAFKLEKRLFFYAKVELEEGYSMVGGGAMPTANLPGMMILISPLKDISLDFLVKKLRQNKPAVIGKVKDNKLILDLRTVLEKEDDLLVKALEKVFLEGGK